MIRHKLLAGFLAVTMLGAPLSVLAEENVNAETINYASAGYLFEKISHPDKPQSTADGIVDYVGNGVVSAKDNGQGDRGQNYSWSAIGYEDDIYIGTCYAAMGNTLTLMGNVLGDKFDKETMRAILNTAFNGTFFYGQEDGADSKSILIKLNTKTAEVKIIMAQSENNISPQFRNAIEYHDKLYFCGAVNDNGSGALPRIYELDPKDDSFKMVQQGMTKEEYFQSYQEGISTSIRGMAVYRDKLVVSCVGVDGPYIMISDDPEKGFTTIATQEDLFNYPAYHFSDSIYGGSIWEMEVFNDSLYVSLCTGTPENKPDDNTMQSFAIVRGDMSADGSFTWTPVVGDQEKEGAKYTFGIDPQRTRSGAGVLQVFGDYLYIGEYNDEEIALENILFDEETGEMPGLDCDFLNANLEQSVGLYRMDKDENIELIVGDPTDMFPEGGISGWGSGFNRHENQYIWEMIPYDGKLFVGTFDTSSLAEPLGQFSNGDILHVTKEEWLSEIQYIKELLEILNEERASEESQSVSVILAEEEIPDTVEKVEEEITSENLLKTEQPSVEIELTEKAESLEKTEISEEVVEELDVLNDDMEAGADALEMTDGIVSYSSEQKNHFEVFYEYYSELKERFEALDEKCELPEQLREAYHKLLNNETLHKLDSVITCMNHLSSGTRGFDMYVSEDGVHFEMITINGFNDPYNHGLRVFAANNQGLSIGTANPFYGTQVWMYRNPLEVVEEEKIEEAGEEEGNPEISVNPVQSEKPGMVNESTPSTGDPAGNIGKYLLLCMSMLTIIAASVWRKVSIARRDK